VGLGGWVGLGGSGMGWWVAVGWDGWGEGGCLNETNQTTGKAGFWHLFDWWARPTLKCTWQHSSQCTTTKHLYTCSTLLIHHNQTKRGITSGYNPSGVLLQTGLHQRKNVCHHLHPCGTIDCAHAG